jgi:hypothetical protein
MTDGTLVLGARHGDELMHSAWRAFSRPGNLLSGLDSQGFIDQRGVFMTRQEAWKVAEAAGQILYRCGGDTRDGGTLYSENLY